MLALLAFGSIDVVGWILWSAITFQYWNHRLGGDDRRNARHTLLVFLLGWTWPLCVAWIFISNAGYEAYRILKAIVLAPRSAWRWVRSIQFFSDLRALVKDAELPKLISKNVDKGKGHLSLPKGD